MVESIVAAFRMPLPGMGLGPTAYMARVRPLCARGEALGGRLIAWSSNLVALAWSLDDIESAVELAASPPGEARELCGWACGVAQGELEALVPDDPRNHLAWGAALVLAASLARVAETGEVLIDGDVSCLRSGRLACAGSRSASDSGRRVSGWKLDLACPWVSSRVPAAVDTGPRGPPSPVDELSSAEVLELSERVEPAPQLEPSARRCRASLELAMAHASANRPREGLVEALDALARALEEGDARAKAACYALLAKLYATVGKVEAASTLRGLATRAAHPTSR